MSSIAIGAIVGSLIVGRVLDWIGRKSTLMAVTPVAVLGWILISIAPHIALVCFGRFLTGLATGFLFAASQVIICYANKAYSSCC